MYATQYRAERLLGREHAVTLIYDLSRRYVQPPEVPWRASRLLNLYISVGGTCTEEATYVCVVLMAKMHLEHGTGFGNLSNAMQLCPNLRLLTLEREIWGVWLQHGLCRTDLMAHVALFVSPALHHRPWHCMFDRLWRQAALTCIDADPRVILAAVLLLYRRRRLKAEYDYLRDFRTAADVAWIYTGFQRYLNQ